MNKLKYTLILIPLIVPVLILTKPSGSDFTNYIPTLVKTEDVDGKGVHEGYIQQFAICTYATFKFKPGKSYANGKKIICIGILGDFMTFEDK